MSHTANGEIYEKQKFLLYALSPSDESQVAVDMTIYSVPSMTKFD